ncbi:DUF6774 domain-containing protein [Clostridium sp.]|uniref:DUF6774 domain-containing protein n=1 Tax=Clostridium sp. TaxID=1506 RepID=UPI003217B073
MDIFDLSPEDLSALALAISIGLAKQYTEDQLEILSALLNIIGDTLGLIQTQRSNLAEKYNSSKSDSKEE